MGEKVFYGKGIRRIKNEDSELYDSIENLDKNVWNANVLDYRTQKLIAIAISATNPELLCSAVNVASLCRLC